MRVKEIEIGEWYELSGDLANGFRNGEPNICHEEVTRRITRVTDTHIICECGRRFIINENLKLSIPFFRQTYKTNP